MSLSICVLIGSEMLDEFAFYQGSSFSLGPGSLHRCVSSGMDLPLCFESVASCHLTIIVQGKFWLVFPLHYTVFDHLPISC